jgi:hypothetical protein
MKAMIVAVTLAQFSDPSGGRIDINVGDVTSVRETRNEGHLAQGSHCMIVMNNGKFIAVREDCDEVRQRLRGSPMNAPCVLMCGETQVRTR